MSFLTFATSKRLTAQIPSLDFSAKRSVHIWHCRNTYYWRQVILGMAFPAKIYIQRQLQNTMLVKKEEYLYFLPLSPLIWDFSQVTMALPFILRRQNVHRHDWCVLWIWIPKVYTQNVNCHSIRTGSKGSNCKNFYMAGDCHCGLILAVVHRIGLFAP